MAHGGVDTSRHANPRKLEITPPAPQGASSLPQRDTNARPSRTSSPVPDVFRSVSPELTKLSPASLPTPVLVDQPLRSDPSPPSLTLIEGFFNSIKTAWRLDARACIMRGRIAMSESIGELLPSFLVPYGVIQLLEGNALTGIATLTGAVVTHLVGCGGRAQKKLAADELTRTITSKLEAEHELGKGEIAEHLGVAKVRALLAQERTTIKHVAAANTAFFDLIGQSIGLAVTTATLATGSLMAASLVFLGGAYYLATEISYARKLAARDTSLRALKDEELTLTTQLSDPLPGRSPSQISLAATRYAEVKREIAKAEQQIDNRHVWYRLANLPFSGVTLGAAAATLMTVDGGASVASKALLPLCLGLLKLNTALQNAVNTMGIMAVESSKGRRHFESAQLINELGTRPPTTRNLSTDTVPHIRATNVSCQSIVTETPLLGGVSLSLLPGTITSVIGEDGSGKSILLEVLAGDRIPKSGSVQFDGVEVSDIHDGDRRELVRNFSSDPRVIRGFSVWRAFRDLGCKKSPEKVLHMLERAGLGKYFQTIEDLKRPLGEEHRDGVSLTEGMMKRVLLLGALMTSAKVILLDDPQDELSDTQANAYLNAIAKRARRRGQTVVIATRDPIASENFKVDSTVFMRDGRILGGD